MAPIQLLALILAQLTPACQHALQLVLLQAPQLQSESLQAILGPGWVARYR